MPCSAVRLYIVRSLRLHDSYRYCIVGPVLVYVQCRDPRPVCVPFVREFVSLFALLNRLRTISSPPWAQLIIDFCSSRSGHYDHRHRNPFSVDFPPPYVGYNDAILAPLCCYWWRHIVVCVLMTMLHTRKNQQLLHMHTCMPNQPTWPRTTRVESGECEVERRRSWPYTLL